MTTNPNIVIQLYKYDAEPDATSYSVADTDSISNYIEGDNFGITLTNPKQSKKELSISLIIVEVW